MEPVLFLIAITASQGSAESAETATRAFLSQTKLDQKFEQLGNRLTTEQQRKHIGNAALAAKVVLERKVSFEWSFP